MKPGMTVYAAILFTVVAKTGSRRPKADYRSTGPICQRSAFNSATTKNTCRRVAAGIPCTITAEHRKAARLPDFIATWHPVA